MTRQGDPRARFARLAATVRLQMDRLASVVAEAELALADFADATPSKRDLRGIAGVVHDFYTRAERIFETIAPELNGGLPAGGVWHRQLLENMTLDLPGIRPPVIAPATAAQLSEFLRFRHLFRNPYGFELEWSRLRMLLARLPAAWAALQADLQRFAGFPGSRRQVSMTAGEGPRCDHPREAQRKPSSIRMSLPVLSVRA